MNQVLGIGLKETPKNQIRERHFFEEIPLKLVCQLLVAFNFSHLHNYFDAKCFGKL